MSKSFVIETLLNLQVFVKYVVHQLFDDVSQQMFGTVAP